MTGLWSADFNSHASEFKPSDVANGMGQDVVSAMKYKEILVTLWIVMTKCHRLCDL